MTFITKMPRGKSRRTFPPPRRIRRTSPYLLTAKDRKLTLTARLGNGMAGEIWVIESPVYQLNGESLTFSIVWDGGTTITGTPSATVYRGRADVTSTVMPAGSHSASGNVITLKPLTALTSGSRYVVAVSANVDASIRVAKIMVICPKIQGEDGGDVWVEESPVVQLPGENIPYAILWEGAEALSSPTVAIYKDRSVTDSAATYLSTGSNSVSGNVQTLKNLSALVGSSRFVMVASCVVDGNTRQVKILVICPPTAGEQ